METLTQGTTVQLDPNHDFAIEFAKHPSVAVLLTGRRATIIERDVYTGKYGPNVTVEIHGPDPFGESANGTRLVIVPAEALVAETNLPETVDLTEILPFASDADRAVLALRLGRGRKMGVRSFKKDGTPRTYNGSVAYDDIHSTRAFIHDTNAAQRRGDSGYRTLLLDKVLTVTVGGKRYICR